MHLQYTLRIAAFFCTVCCIYGSLPACLGGDNSVPGTQVEIWLGNERVQRPRLNRVIPPRSTTADVDPSDRLGGALATERKPEDRGGTQGMEAFEEADTGRPKPQTDTPAAFSPIQSSIHPLAPPETTQHATSADALGQARLLLMQSIELVRRADAILGETAIPKGRFESDAPSSSASPPRTLEATEEPSHSPAGSSAKANTSEHPISGEQESPPRSKASNAAAPANPPATISPTGATSPGLPMSGLTRPTGSAIPPLVGRSVELGGPREKSVPRVAGSETSWQRVMPRTQQATLVAPPRFDAKAIGVLVVLLLAVLVVLEFGGRLRSRIGVDRAGFWRRLSRRRPVPSTPSEEGTLSESAGPEQALLAAVVAHNLRLRGGLLAR